VLRKVDGVLADERDPFVLEERTHDGRMAPGPSTGQLAVAVDDTVSDRRDVRGRVM
jgi:hypothetical protein